MGIFGAKNSHLVCNFETRQIWWGVVVKSSVNAGNMKAVTTLKELSSEKDAWLDPDI